MLGPCLRMKKKLEYTPGIRCGTRLYRFLIFALFLTLELGEYGDDGGNVVS